MANPDETIRKLGLQTRPLRSSSPWGDPVPSPSKKRKVGFPFSPLLPRTWGSHSQNQANLPQEHMKLKFHVELSPPHRHTATTVPANRGPECVLISLIKNTKTQTS